MLVIYSNDCKARSIATGLEESCIGIGYDGLKPTSSMKKSFKDLTDFQGSK